MGTAVRGCCLAHPDLEMLRGRDAGARGGSGSHILGRFCTAPWVLEHPRTQQSSSFEYGGTEGKRWLAQVPSLGRSKALKSGRGGMGLRPSTPEAVLFRTGGTGSRVGASQGQEGSLVLKGEGTSKMQFSVSHHSKALGLVGARVTQQEAAGSLASFHRNGGTHPLQLHGSQGPGGCGH